MFGFRLVRDTEVGIVTKTMFGKKMPAGHIIATNGEIGVQADILMPGLYWRMPFVYKIEKGKVTRIPQGNVGIVESIDGRPTASGRLLGDAVECNSFQDAKAFLEHGGCKGPQVAALRPGTYRINEKIFRVTAAPAVNVPPEQVGVVIAQDGVSLPSGYIVAPAPTAECQHFQDGQAFINASGYRGPQLETLQPGEYYINPLLFNTKNYPVAMVPPGYVAVVISSVGKELDRSSGKAPAVSKAPTMDGPLVEAGETALITDKTERGILKEPVAPGKYNLNQIGYRVELVPTSAVTIDWASADGVRETTTKDSKDSRSIMPTETAKVAEFFKFSQLKVTSKDGFQLEVDVRLIIRIPPANAPSVIARFGTVNNLIEQVAHPLIDSSFRNAAGQKAAMEFVHSRTDLQKQALDNVREEFSKYHVEVQGLLIAYIKVDQALLETQTKKEIAKQQQEQYDMEAAAQEKRIAVMEKTARADKQPDVIAAKLSIDIAADKADAQRREAEGIRDATKTKADGISYEAQKVGEGTAAAYKAQTEVLGAESIVAIKVIEEIASGKIKITPDVQVSGENNGNLFNAFLATLIEKKTKEAKAEAAE